MRSRKGGREKDFYAIKACGTLDGERASSGRSQIKQHSGYVSSIITLEARSNCRNLSRYGTQYGAVQCRGWLRLFNRCDGDFESDYPIPEVASAGA